MSQVDINRETFDPTKKEHRELLQSTTKSLQKSLADLKGNDRYLMGAVAVAAAGYFLPSFWVLPTKTMAMVGAGLAVQCYNWRRDYNEKYKSVLNDAKAIYRWCYKDNPRLALRTPVVRDLTSVLGPLLSNSDIKQWQAADLIAQDFSDTQGFREQAQQLLARGRQAIGQQSPYYLPLHERVSDSYQNELKGFTDGGHMTTLDYRLYGDAQPSMNFESLLTRLVGNMPIVGGQARQIVQEVFMQPAAVAQP